MLPAAPGRSTISRHALSSTRAARPGATLPLFTSTSFGGVLTRRHHLGGLICHTRGQGGSPFTFQVQGTSPGSKHGSGSTETFQQLRQAVLSSLDFSDNSEQVQDWDDSLYDSTDDVPIEPAGSAAAVGKAVYEVS